MINGRKFAVDQQLFFGTLIMSKNHSIFSHRKGYGSWLFSDKDLLYLISLLLNWITLL